MREPRILQHASCSKALKEIYCASTAQPAVCAPHYRLTAICSAPRVAAPAPQRRRLGRRPPRSLPIFATCQSAATRRPPAGRPPASEPPRPRPRDQPRPPRAGAAGLRCAFALAGCGGCGGGSSRWSTAAAVAFASAGCCCSLSTLAVDSGSPYSPEDSIS